MPLYDQIGVHYDTTRKADPEIIRRLRYHLQLNDGSDVLDIACGTGNYTTALQESSLQMSGVDISVEMLAQAQKKSKYVRWQKADANQLPFENNSYAGATCVLSIHHFQDLLGAFNEVYRILDHGRRFVIFTSTPEQMHRYWLKEYFPEAIEKSAEQMPDVEQVSHVLEKVGFHLIGVESFLIQPDLKDFFLYSGKYDPKMYLNETVRSGISTFSNLASPEEVRSGCEKLEEDIGSGRIDEVLRQYNSVSGDYLFIVVEKRALHKSFQREELSS